MLASQQEQQKRLRDLQERPLARPLKLDFGTYTVLGATVTIVEARPESNAIRFAFREAMNNKNNNLHGGAIATLVDVLTSWTIRVYDQEGRSGVSTNISVDYISAAPSGSELIADAKVLRIGKTLAFCEMEVRMKDTNALVAKATHTKFMPVSSKSKPVPAKL